MNSELRMGSILLAALMACGLGACTTQEAQGGTGGTVPQGGNGGSTAVAGSTGATDPSKTDGVACLPPAGALITDFTYVPTDPDAGAPVTKEVRFGNWGTTLTGGEFIYPETGNWPLVSDVTQNNWHISGSVGTYSGLGLYVDNCSVIDASAYKGLSFKIGGTVELGGTVTLEVATLEDTVTAEWKLAHGETDVKPDAPGRCVPPASAANEWSQDVCVLPKKTIKVEATLTEQKVLWADIAGGKPQANVGEAPHQIVGIRWILPNPTGAGTTSPTPYKVDIILDDLSFIP